MEHFEQVNFDLFNLYSNLIPCPHLNAHNNDDIVTCEEDFQLQSSFTSTHLQRLKKKLIEFYYLINKARSDP